RRAAAEGDVGGVGGGLHPAALRHLAQPVGDDGAAQAAGLQGRQVVEGVGAGAVGGAGVNDRAGRGVDELDGPARQGRLGDVADAVAVEVLELAGAVAVEVLELEAADVGPDLELPGAAAVHADRQDAGGGVQVEVVGLGVGQAVHAGDRVAADLGPVEPAGP